MSFFPGKDPAAGDPLSCDAITRVIVPRTVDLGDFAVRPRPTRVPELLERLHGEKHLIAGNNDGPVTRGSTSWASVRDYAEIELDGRRLVLCHYPLRSWNGMGRGAINLHGHSQGRMAPLPR